MEPNKNHIYREKQEFKRLMENFAVKPSQATTTKIERMLEGQREKFQTIEQARSRSQSRSPRR